MRVPRPKPGCDIRSLPLSPAEAFLLSRIDGTITERDLSLMTALPQADVSAALTRLAGLGAIDFAETPKPTAAEARGAAGPTQPRAGAQPAGVAREAAPSPRIVMETASGSAPLLYDPAELDEPVELDAEKKRRILDIFYRLEELTYYQVLGVDEQVDKKRIKSAYYAMAPDFHPDKFFRKNLGSFKAKIEAIFNRVTMAHDVLTAKDRRAEYDEYLAQTQKNRAMAAIIEQTPRDVARIQAAVDVSAASPVMGLSSPGRYASEPLAGGLASNPPTPSVPAWEGPVPTAAELAQSRRDTLARKLMAVGRKPGPQAVAPDTSATQRAAEAIRARHEAAVAEARRNQLQRHLDNGKALLQRKEFAAAANAYRIAASLAPEDEGVQATCLEATRLADVALADGYWKQACYEEGQDRWAEAALSYAKVCNGQPNNARAHERVAVTTLRSSANVRRAVDFARRAVELEPKSAPFRLTLASAYMAAGLERSALGEIERALELAPGDAKIKELSQQVRLQTQKPGN